MKSLLSNPIVGDWAVSITTILLILTTLLFHFIGDSYTRLLKKREQYKFYQNAYEFLKSIFPSMGSNRIVPGSKNLTAKESIEEFQQEFLKNTMYLSSIDQYHAKKFIKLSIKLSEAWDKIENSDGKFDKINKCQNQIITAMDKISKKIGKSAELKEFRKKMNY